jgi:hypothetical protein
MLELMELRRSMARSDPAWTAANVVVAFRAQLEHMEDRDLADRVLLDALGCEAATPQCAPVARSGLVRRILFERSMGAGDRAFDRAALQEKSRLEWWSMYSPPTGDRSQLDNRYLRIALTHYEDAKTLVSHELPDEQALLDERAQPIARLLPEGSPEANRASALLSP